MHYISGYVRNDNGAGISGVTCTLKEHNTNTTLPIGSQYGLVANPVSTDINGFFQFQIEKNPGQSYVVADLNGDGSVTKIRSSKEEFVSSGAFSSDGITFLSTGYTDGILGDLASNYVPSVSGSVRQVTVGPGIALIGGGIFSIDTPYVFPIPANTSLANRVDTVSFMRVIDHTNNLYGYQSIVFTQGTVTGVANPPVSTASILYSTICTVNTAQNASVSTLLADNRKNVSRKFYVSGEVPVTAINPTDLATTVVNGIISQSPTIMTVPNSPLPKKFLAQPVGASGSGNPAWSTIALNTLSNVLTNGAGSAGQYLSNNGSTWEAKTDSGIVASSRLLDGSTITSIAASTTVQPATLSGTITWTADQIGRTYDIVVFGTVSIAKTTAGSRVAWAINLLDSTGTSFSNGSGVGHTETNFHSDFNYNAVFGYVPTAATSPNSALTYQVTIANTTNGASYGGARIVCLAIPRS